MPNHTVAEELRLWIPLQLESLQRRQRGLAPLDVEQAKAVDENLSKVLAIAEAFDAGREEAERNGDLSPEGKSKIVTKLAMAAQQRLGEFEAAHVTAVRVRAQQLAASVLTTGTVQRPTDPAERIAYEMRQRELRDQLRGLSQMERDLIYLSAPDSFVLDAMETAPPVLVRPDQGPPQLAPFVDPERIAVAMLERSRAKNPEAAATLETLERLANVYSSAVNTVRTAILAQVPAAGPQDPMAVQAGAAR